MQLIKKTKKGFTLVELIVVIAIVAILAAVSVVSYIAFINSANESADLQLVKQINLCMEASEALHGKNGNMQQALDTAFDNGFVIENLTPRSNKDIVWNSETNRFELLDHAPASHPEIMFKIYNSVAEMVDGQASEGYSPYLNSKEDFHDALEDKTGSRNFVTRTGFDAGDNQTIQQMIYRNTGGKQTVVFRTNSGDLIVDGELDTVKHYGVGRYLTIEQVGPTDCYHEYGVFGEVEIQEGKLIVQNSGFVGSVTATGTNETVAIENNGTIMDATGASQIDITGSGNLESTTIEVSSFEQFQGLAFACNQGTTFEGYTLKLMTDIDMTNKIWIPFGTYEEKEISNFKGTKVEKCNMICLDDSYMFMGTIDGNGKKIINLSNDGFNKANIHQSVSGTVGSVFGLIAFGAGDITIKNLDISFAMVENANQALNGVGLIGCYYTHEIEPFIKWEKVGGVWQRTINENFDYNDTKVYQVQEKTVTFDHVTTSGTIIAKDAASAYVGTTYLSYSLYNFNGAAEDRYSSAKNITEQKYTMYGKNYPSADAQTNITLDMLKENASERGEFYEGLYVNNNSEVVFKHGDDTLVGVNNAVCGVAPVYAKFVFNNCLNTANVIVDKRGGIFVAKCSYEEIRYDNIEINFINTTNGGNVITKDATNKTAGIVSGFMCFEHVANRGTWLDGLTNTGKIYTRSGDEDTLLPEAEDFDIYACYSYDPSNPKDGGSRKYSHVTPVID